ncbi:hypothetical protein BDF22DRAFT_655213 [Syncephalis plumigaleata]|nr:hypothetical protein BDF22DRAFT_655213 [Syncephalis plumigaleata]
MSLLINAMVSSRIFASLLSLVTSGPLRIFKGSLPYPGIVVSRSLGDDVAQRLGVLCEPEVQVRELIPDDCYLILATDGVWDGMSSQEVATFVDREACSDSNVDAATASSRLNEVALKALDANQIDDNISNDYKV